MVVSAVETTTGGADSVVEADSAVAADLAVEAALEAEVDLVAFPVGELLIRLIFSAGSTRTETAS